MRKLTPFISYYIVEGALEGHQRVHNIIAIDNLKVVEVPTRQIAELRKVAVKGKEVKEGDLVIFGSEVFLVEGV